MASSATSYTQVAQAAPPAGTPPATPPVNSTITHNITSSALAIDVTCSTRGHQQRRHRPLHCLRQPPEPPAPLITRPVAYDTITIGITNPVTAQRIACSTHISNTNSLRRLQHSSP